jgi:hypothetical protein
MLKPLALAGALLCVLTICAYAKPRVIIADPGCNVIFPCDGVAPSVRGERYVKAFGFGAAQKVYTPSRLRPAGGHIVSHPRGCPARAFCGCGASVESFGHSVRSLWLARAWFRFPRVVAAPTMAAVRSHHVMILKHQIEGVIWMVYDANSGGHATRIHARSIAGYVIVNPRA